MIQTGDIIWILIVLLTLVAIVVGVVIYLKEPPGKEIIVWNKTYPIEIENEFREVRSSYVEYWITKNDTTGELKFHYSGKYAKAHEGYNNAYDYYLKLIAYGNRTST